VWKEPELVEGQMILQYYQKSAAGSTHVIISYRKNLKVRTEEDAEN
jgi:hypothetical protein